MPDVVIHIGLTKTGSSAIQHALAKHRGRLAREGVHYAAVSDEQQADPARVGSGNGSRIGYLLNASVSDASKLEAMTPAAFAATYLDPESRTNLISSEAIAGADPSLLAQFRDGALSAHRIRVVAYVRDLYPHAAANWMQAIKVRGYASDFVTFCREVYQDPQARALKHFSEAFGADAMTVLHYESCKDRLLESFLDVLGVGWRPREEPPLVNRSLSAAEVEVLLECAKLYRRPMKLAKIVTDHLLSKHPHRTAAGIWDREAAAYLRRAYGENLDWINGAFFGGKRTVRFGYRPGPALSAASEEREEVWKDVVEALAKEVVRMQWTTEKANS
jgi:hypothetical protein